jgi:hypothetical protein
MSSSGLNAVWLANRHRSPQGQPRRSRDCRARVIPEFLWELSLGIYATVWGFRRCPIPDAYDSEFPTESKRELAPAYPGGLCLASPSLTLGYSRPARAVSSVGRAPARQAGGHWFEPSTAHLLKAPLRRGFYFAWFLERAHTNVRTMPAVRGRRRILLLDAGCRSSRCIALSNSSIDIQGTTGDKKRASWPQSEDKR